MQLREIKNVLSRPSRAAFAVAATAVLACGGLGGGIASAATPAAASQPHPVPFPGAATAPSAGPLAPAAAAGCTPYVDGDYAHVSSGDVSGHGWWYQNDCANTKTTVTIGLQEYFSDGTWHDQGTGEKNVYPGGGSANRAAVRQVCGGVALAAWRTYVIVSIGDGASAYTNAQNLNCTHW